MIQILNLTVRVIDGTGKVTMQFGIQNPRVNVLLATVEAQFNAEQANEAALAAYDTAATNYQQAAINGRLETTLPALVWPVKPKMQVVGDPTINEKGVVVPGVATEVDFFPALVDFVPPKVFASSGPATAAAFVASGQTTR